MHTEIREVQGVTIIRPEGKITIGEGDVRMREAVDKALADGRKKLIVDLGKVSFMDSSGVGELVGCFTTVMNRGGKLKLLNLTKKINDLLQVTQLITVFDCYQDEVLALKSYAG